MRVLSTAFLAAVILASPAGQLTAATRAAFDQYVSLTEARIAGELSGASPFLWIDRQPDRQTHLAQLSEGRVVTARLETRDAGRAIQPEDGMLHHWIGTVLIPNATLDEVRTFVQNYDRYAEHFAPMIVRSKVLSRSGSRFVASMRTVSKKVITVVIDADYTVDYRVFGPTKMYTKSVTTNVHEVEDAGTPGERRHPADQRDAFLWRLNTYCSFEQRAEGVYEQCESVSLTRQIPWAVRLVVRPFVTGVPRDTLEQTLGAVRARAGR